MKNKVAVKDNNGDVFFVDTTDERYISGELVGLNKNKHWKQKVISPHKGRKWMYKDNEMIRLPEEKFEEYLNNGWKFGKPKWLIIYLWHIHNISTCPKKISY